jgi:hypothetical protein
LASGARTKVTYAADIVPLAVVKSAKILRSVLFTRTQKEIAEPTVTYISKAPFRVINNSRLITRRSSRGNCCGDRNRDHPNLSHMNYPQMKKLAPQSYPTPMNGANSPSNLVRSLSCHRVVD